MARVHFGSGIVHELFYARDPFTGELLRVSLSENLVQLVSYHDIATELEALKESPELTVKLKLFLT